VTVSCTAVSDLHFVLFVQQFCVHIVQLMINSANFDGVVWVLMAVTVTTALILCPWCKTDDAL